MSEVRTVERNMIPHRDYDDSRFSVTSVYTASASGPSYMYLGTKHVYLNLDN